MDSREIGVRLSGPNRFHSQYILNVLEYSNNGQEGFLKFDGVDSSQFDTLPLTLTMVVFDIEHVTESLTKSVNHRQFRVEITAREVLKDTSESWWEEEFQCMMCLTPTAVQILRFRVLEEQQYPPPKQSKG